MYSGLCNYHIFRPSINNESTIKRVLSDYYYDNDISNFTILYNDEIETLKTRNTHCTFEDVVNYKKCAKLINIDIEGRRINKHAECRDLFVEKN